MVSNQQYFSGIHIVFTLISLLISCPDILAQQTDIVSWTNIALSSRVSSKSVIVVKPIHRRFQNLREHQNTSIDIIWGYRYNRRWSGGLLHRTFFVPNRKERHFLFVDLKYAIPMGRWIIRNGLRYHQAWDINITDPDFLRWKPLVSYDIHTKLRLFASHDWFYRLNGFNIMQRVRYEAGFNLRFDKLNSLNVQYWHEREINQDATLVNHMIVTTFQHRLP